jgi:GGDEF domain-containing protein
MSVVEDSQPRLGLLAGCFRRLRGRAGRWAALAMLERELEALRLGAGPLSVILLGVPVQRRWRRQAARALRPRLRRDHVLFRLAAGELLVICPDTDAAVVRGLAGDLHRVLMAMGVDGGHAVGSATAVAQIGPASLLDQAVASRLRNSLRADHNGDGQGG